MLYSNSHPIRPCPQIRGGANETRKTVALLIGVLAAVFFISLIVRAWTEPSQAPPGGNVPAPINVGSVTQVKSGKLGIATDGIDSSYGLTVGNSANLLGIKSSGNSYFEKDVFFKTFKISPIFSTELGIYDSNGNLIMIFDQGI